ncbi:hypothetical protein [Halorussus ruber]|uniref:hypothetical protein n=1 Tax=Halorussus ruber TaxID=1126238 RepID=UPI001092AD5D|nr:hypothetical protein [Halorussus ruber]
MLDRWSLLRCLSVAGLTGIAGCGGDIDPGTDNRWVGNVASTDGAAWDISSATRVRTMANRPNPAGKGLVLTSSNGTEYEITVADDGTLETSSL